MKIFDFYKEQKRRMKENKKYLKKGIYVILYNRRTYYRLGCKNLKDKLPKGSITLKGILLYLIGILFYSVKVKQNGKFGGEAVYFSTTPDPLYKDAKIFDYDNKLVMTLCPNRKRYDLYMKNRARFSGKFPMPALVTKDDDTLMFTEEFIESVKFENGSENQKRIYHTLFEFYKNYFDNCEKEPFLHIKETDDEIKVLGALQHGDLSADNFKADKNLNIVFFDFDHGRVFPLYYDVFFLLFNEGVTNKNYYGIELLLKGEFNRYFDNGVSLYLKSFMTEFYNIRLKNIANDDQIKRYYELYNEVSGRLEGDC